MEDQKKYISFKLPSKNLLQISVIVIVVIASFIIGSLWMKIQYLEQTKVSSATAQNNTVPDGQTPQRIAPTEDLTPRKVSVDNDPIMGNTDAKVTIIEFSDYECPFCKMFYDQTLPQLKKDYIDTGKAKLVYRDLPLSFHANAHKEAEAAECARDQGGDISYFKYHDEIFKRTTSNGTGLALDQLPIIAQDLGLDSAQFTNCFDSGKYKDEVNKDIADATTYGATATPTFFIGKSSSSGIFFGTKVTGAQPFSVFKSVIDQQLQ